MSAVALAVVMTSICLSLFDGLSATLIDSATRLTVGHVQLHAPGYLDDRRLARSFAATPALARARATPQVVAAAPRVYGVGIAASGDARSAAVILSGIDPEREPTVSELHHALVAGRDVAAPHEVVIGDRLARLLAAAPDSELVLLAPAADGSMGNDRFKVVGVAHTGVDTLDETLARVEIGGLRELLAMAPDRAHEIALRCDRPGHADAVAAALGRDRALAGLDVRSWMRLMPFVADAAHIRAQSGRVVGTVAFLIAAIALFNTMLSAVLERRRELGILAAVGMSPLRLVLMIASETLTLALLGAVAGAVISIGTCAYLARHGIPTGAHGGMQVMSGVVLGDRLYGDLPPAEIVRTALTFLLLATAAALLAGARAARARPAEAIR